jgi:hypothetical protein
VCRPAACPGSSSPVVRLITALVLNFVSSQATRSAWPGVTHGVAVLEASRPDGEDAALRNGT